MKRWIIFGMLFGVIAVTVIWGAMMRSGTPVQVAVARRGEIREYVDERAKTRVPRVYQISAPQNGRIGEITLAEGDAVSKGQVVAQFVSEDLENTVAEARAAVERLNAAIVENDDAAVEKSLALQAAEFVQSMNKTVEAAMAQVDASAKRAEYAETKLGRAQKLIESRAAAEDELDKATLDYWEGQLGFRQDSLTVEAMRSIQAATALLPQMVSDYISHKQLTRAVLEKQKAEAEARLRQIEVQSQRGTMTSPVDGVVLERFVEDEQHLTAGTPLLAIGQLDRLEVEADVLSQDVVRVQPGAAAEVYGPAVGGELGSGLIGSVEKIYPAGFTKVSSLGVEQQRVRVVVGLRPEDVERLRQDGVGVDYRVRVRIYTQQSNDALLVPRSALFRGPDGHWQLFAAQGRRAALRSVQVGLMNDIDAEILEGLADGDRVILAPDSNLVHGARISPL